MWEATAGGSALCGESPLDCARRELLEETGLSGEFTRIGTVVHDGHRSIYAEFLCVTDHDKNSVRLQTGETAASKWVGFEKLKSMEAELASVTIPFAFDPRRGKYIRVSGKTSLIRCRSQRPRGGASSPFCRFRRQNSRLS